jgi:dTDP-6-deoxy-L-talose 4-dehydrogenase (NAD+)
VKAQVALLRGDLAEPDGWSDALERWGPEGCVHLAWYVEPGRYLHSPENVTAMTSSLALLRKLIDIECRRVVMIGTCAEYDGDVRCLREDGATRPATLYAAAKLATGLVGEQLATAAGIDFAWARIFYPYGPYEDSRRALPSLVRTLLRGQRFAASGGEQIRDYVHAEDVANALWLLLDRRLAGVYNVSSGVPVTVRRMMEMVADLAGVPADLIDFGAAPHRSWEPPMICGDNGRLRAAGWTPRYSLAEGLEQTLHWWQNHEAMLR